MTVWKLLYALSTLAVIAAVEEKREPVSQTPAEQLPDLDLLSQPMQVMQPVESAETIPLQMQLAAPAEQSPAPAEHPMGRDAIHGFCCYYSSSPENPCSKCQARDGRAWNANPSNCANSGGTHCSGVVGLFSIDEDVAPINRKIVAATAVPLPELFKVFGLGASCGFASVMVAFSLICMRRPWHDYALVSTTDHPLLVSEGQGEYVDSAA